MFRLPAALLVASLSACVGTADGLVQDEAAAIDGPQASSRAKLAMRPFPDSNGQVGAAWIPLAILDVDDKPKDASTPSADVDAGDGWAVRGGRYDDSLGFEAVVATTRHDETRTGAELTTWAAYADLTDRWELWRGPVSAWMGVGFGFGLIRFDWDSSYRSQLTMLWQGEGIFALQFGPHVSIEARAMGFLAAHPTDTVATGALGMLGGSVAF